MNLIKNVSLRMKSIFLKTLLIVPFPAFGVDFCIRFCLVVGAIRDGFATENVLATTAIVSATLFLELASENNIATHTENYNSKNEHCYTYILAIYADVITKRTRNFLAFQAHRVQGSVSFFLLLLFSISEATQ